MFFRRKETEGQGAAPQVSRQTIRVRGGGMSPLSLLIAFAVVAAITWFLASWNAGSTITTSYSTRVLNVENLMSLITSRSTTQVYFHQRRDSSLLGPDEAIVLGEVEVEYGVDFTQLDKSDIKTTDETVEILIPPVEVTSVRLKDGSLKVINKSTMLQKLAGPRTDERYNEYIAGLKSSAREFAEQNGLEVQAETAKRRIHQHFSTMFPNRRVTVRTKGDPVPVVPQPVERTTTSTDQDASAPQS